MEGTTLAIVISVVTLIVLILIALIWLAIKDHEKPMSLEPPNIAPPQPSPGQRFIPLAGGETQIGDLGGFTGEDFGMYEGSFPSWMENHMMMYHPSQASVGRYVRPDGDADDYVPYTGDMMM